MIFAIQAVFLRMFVAHLLGDFYLQKDEWVENKKKFGWKSRDLYFHSGLIAVITYVFSGLFYALWIIPVILISHAAIDMLKVRLDSRCNNCAFSYVFDQVLHIVVLVAVTLVIEGCYGPELSVVVPEIFANPLLLAVVTAYLLIITPAGFFIKSVLDPIRGQVNNSEADHGQVCKNLDNAGSLIGYLERILILTFVLIGQYAAIGFLITAKSIFRFREGRNYLVEYYLLGTFLSMTVVILIGLATVFSFEIFWPDSLSDLLILLHSIST